VQPAQPAVQIGDVLASKYRVERILGHGGMGVVVAARHEQLGFLVALKFMLPGFGTAGVPTQRFLREARAAGSLHGEHVARVTDFGTLESGAPYIVMEFLQGTDLQGVLDRVGPLPVHEAAEYLRQACKGMAEAHALGIVHRDLKPQNLFLTKRPDGTPLVKVLDFGISKLVGHDASMSVTSSTEMMGSPLYMAPEQVRSSKNVDSRADIYSLGVILYQLVTGRVPIEAETLGELFEQMFTQPMQPPSTHRPDLPAEFDSLIMRCLAKNPDERLATVTELEAALAPFIEPARSLRGFAATPMNESGAAAVAAVAIAAPAVSQPRALGPTTNAPAVSERQVPRARRRLPVLVGAGAAIAVLVVGGASALLLHSRTAPAVGATVAPTVAASATPPAPEPAPTPSATLGPSDTPAPSASEAPSASSVAAAAVSASPTASGSAVPARKRPASPSTASPRPSASPSKPPKSADPFSTPD
jgi:tRNA A-37 threonylcarbamoyl transferase component Bud32